MSERKTLTITEVGQLASGDRKDGKGKWQSLPFKAKDGDKELSYSTFRTSLFDAIKQGATINADVEVKQDGDWIKRQVMQIYVDGQPLGGQKQGFRGKSPEELDQTARTMCLSYGKDAVLKETLEGQKVDIDRILAIADRFVKWVKNDKAPESKLEAELFDSPKPKTSVEEKPEPDLKSLKFKNAGEFYTACLKELKLSKTRVDAEIAEYDLSKADQREKAWQQIMAIYGHKIEP